MKRTVQFLAITLILLVGVLTAVSFNSIGGLRSNDDGVRLFIDLLRPTGSCQTTHDADSTSAYALLAGKLPSAGLDYNVNLSGIPSNLTTAEFQAAIDASLETWNDALAVAGFGADLDRVGTTSAKPGKKDGTNTVGFGKGAFGAVGVTWTWVSGGIVIESDTVLSTSGFGWSANTGLVENPSNDTDDCAGEASKFDMQEVLVHEFGHTVRLGHPDNNRQTMWGFVAYKQVYGRSLASGDLSGVDDKY